MNEILIITRKSGGDEETWGVTAVGHVLLRITMTSEGGPTASVEDTGLLFPQSIG